MATQSFMKDFTVDKRRVKSLIKALDNSKQITLNSTAKISELKKEQIKKFFSLNE